MRSFRHGFGFTSRLLAAIGIVACHGSAPQPIVTSVGRSVGTIVQTAGVIDESSADCGTDVPPPLNPQTFFAGLSPAERTFPFVGFQIWRNTNGTCRSSRRDAYRAVVTFNMSSVSQLKGLVTKADLVINTHALPSGIGTPGCLARVGGTLSLQRFGPNAPTLPVSGPGSITVITPLPPASSTGGLGVLLPSGPFPTGNTVFTVPRPWLSGSVAGATSSTTTALSGTGGVSFDVDVTSQVNAALNGGFPSMSWMLTGAMEGPFTAPAPSNVDCRTAYQLDLQLTHF